MTVSVAPEYPPGYKTRTFLGPESPDVNSKYVPSNEAIFKSPWGPFPPHDPELNMHDFGFPPDQALFTPDYPLFINAATEETVTLHQFYDRVCALSRALRWDGPNPLGFGKSPISDQDSGEILAVVSRNHLSWPVLGHACMRSELVFGGISPGSTSYELWHTMRKMQATSVVVHESMLPVLLDALKLGKGPANDLQFVLDTKKIIVLTDDSRLSKFQGYPTLESLIKKGKTFKEVPRKRLGGDRLAYLFQSSGTSGLPKAMMITHKNAIATAQQGMITGTRAAEFLGAPPTHGIILGIVPAYHSYGTILWILRINLSTSTNIMLPKWDLELGLKTIQKYKINYLPLVPPVVRQLAQSSLTDKYDLSSVTNAGSGAAYLPPDVAHQFGLKLPNQTPIPSGYGLSEAASVSSPVVPGIFGLPASDPTSIGFLLPGVYGRVVDPDTLKDVKKGEKGEFWVKSNVVTPGYFRDPKATAEIFTEPGWLRTGDLVVRDENDQVTYLDRMKEMIKVKGLQVAATEVENTLLDHPEGLVKDACVAGVDNGRGDGSLFPRGWVVLSDHGKALDEKTLHEKLHAHLEKHLSKHKQLVGGIETVESIPRTPSGKMLRRQMRDAYHDRIKLQSSKSKL